MGQEIVRYEVRGPVALLTLDDGKANAVSPAVVEALHGALDRAAAEAGAVVLAGRPGRFSAGFDLGVMRQGGDALRDLVASGARLAFRLYGFERPVVIACTGHALALGAVLLLTGDTRIGAPGDFKLGLNEVAIGMTLPRFAVDLGLERLSKRHRVRAMVEAEIYSPAGAVDAGFLDRVAAPGALLDEALAEGERLAALPGAAYHGTKLRLRGARLEKMQVELDEDMKSLATPQA